VSYDDWLDVVLAWFGCCAVLVRDGVVDYCGHCSFDVGSREIRWKDSSGGGMEALCEHDSGIYEIMVVLPMVCWSSMFRVIGDLYQGLTVFRTMSTNIHVPMCRSTSWDDVFSKATSKGSGTIIFRFRQHYHV